MMAQFEQLKISVNPVVHRKITAIKLAMENEKQRQVTMNEVLDYLTGCYGEVQRSRVQADALIEELRKANP
jgi:hypothetical protein